MNDTIAAISTPIGEGAIAVIRLSGPTSVTIADEVFAGKSSVVEFAPRVQHLGAIVEQDTKLDDVLLTVFRAPHSYTGENLVEIACHGGVLVTRRILELLLARGARSAEAGEFTQRAFLHGKMDLTQAEAVMDLISAQTDLALRAASEQLEGTLGKRIEAVRGAFVDLLANVEAYIDFPDEDIEPETGLLLIAKVDAILDETQALLDTASHGRVLREGLRTVIYGAPNAGKSSLLNVLLGYERAIVSARPGTTRDMIEEVVNLCGYPVRLIDTAGIRDSDDEIEQAGMARTRRQVELADLVLHVVDASAPKTNDAAVGEWRAKSLLILNKADLDEHADWRGADGVRISCLKNQGIDALNAAIVQRITGGGAAHRNWSVAINARHQACLQQVRMHALAAREGMAEGRPPEFVAQDLRDGMQAVGEIVGRVDSDEILGKIFSTFCIGK